MAPTAFGFGTGAPYHRGGGGVGGGAQTPDPNVIALYNFENNALDETPYHHDLTLGSAASVSGGRLNFTGGNANSYAYSNGFVPTFDLGSIFTVEGYVIVPTQVDRFSTIFTLSSMAGAYLMLRYDGENVGAVANAFQLITMGNQVNSAVYDPTSSPTFHFAVVQSGDLKLWLNGGLQGTMPYTAVHNDLRLMLGNQGAGANGEGAPGSSGAYTGALRSFKASKGALYTAPFTPPTEPLTGWL